MARLALFLVALALLAGCGGGSDRGVAEGSGTSGGSAGQAGVEVEGETLEGESLSLAALRGKPVFVNVWASW
jgi:hypothetical protein